MENYTQEKEVIEEKCIDMAKMDEVFMEKTESLLGKSNDSFQGLCKTLESEQQKLTELEARRVKLQEEMQKLRVEIEDEKRLFEEDVASVTQQRTLENHLPDPVDVTKLNIDLKSDFMRQFLAQQTRELQNAQSEQVEEVLKTVYEATDETQN